MTFALLYSLDENDISIKDVYQGLHENVLLSLNHGKKNI